MMFLKVNEEPLVTKGASCCTSKIKIISAFYHGKCLKTSSSLVSCSSPCDHIQSTSAKNNPPPRTEAAVPLQALGSIPSSVPPIDCAFSKASSQPALAQHWFAGLLFAVLFLVAPNKVVSHGSTYVSLTPFPSPAFLTPSLSTPYSPSKHFVLSVLF